MKTAYFYHPDCTRHAMGSGHPEAPERVRVIHQALEKSGMLNEHLALIEANLASKDALALAHTPQHIDRIFDASPSSGSVQLDPDTSMNPHSLRAALLAAGSVIQAVDAVLSENYYNAFCNVRPPGHHAEKHRPMGFCMFNNIAVGMHHALRSPVINKIALVDFDVHHGNGTEDIFREDPRVLLCQTFQSPFYPFTGETHQADPHQAKHIINCPLPSGASSMHFQASFEKFCFPELRAFSPDMIFISAGFDAHRDDPLAQCNLLEEDYAWVTKKIYDIAEEYCPGKIVSSLEGGYHLDALAKSAVAHINALIKR